METKQQNSGVSDRTQQMDVEIVSFEDRRSEEKLIIQDEDMSSNTSSPTKQKLRLENEDNLDSTEAEMGDMKEENERLKKTLEQIKNDYKSLQTRFNEILQHEQHPAMLEVKSPKSEAKKEDDPETSLSLGFQSASKRKKDDVSRISPKDRKSVELMSEGLSLGLEFKSTPRIDLTDDRSERSNEIENTKDDVDDTTEDACRPSKVLKTADNSEKQEESDQSNSPKRARVSVRARCETPTMNDGCQWRKYGQKIAKGNPCPRAYYRCTVAPACPVRKQVQRCSDDMSILITTYEGTHSHPLPVAATAMASTTSAAASILLSGSSTSQDASLSASATTTANLNGLNFTLYNNSKPGQINLPNCSSPTPPTITLDLTANSSSQFTKRFSSNFFPSHKYSRSLDFSSSEAATFPTLWSNSSYPNYGSLTSNTNSAGSISFGKSSQEQVNHPYMDRVNHSVTSSTSSQHYLTETLTKVLTSDPSFQSAVAAAISTMVGSSNNNAMNTSRINAESMAQSLRWGNQSPGISISTMPQSNKECIPHFLNRSTSSTMNSQAAGSFMMLQPQFPFSLSRTSSTPDLKDHIKKLL